MVQPLKKGRKKDEKDLIIHSENNLKTVSCVILSCFFDRLSCGCLSAPDGVESPQVLTHKSLVSPESRSSW